MFVSDGMICNYADTTIYVTVKNEEIIRKLENDAVTLSNWFRDNSMKGNGKNAT